METVPTRDPWAALGSLGIIVLNHNGLPHLEAGLPGVVDQRGIPGPPSVMVADNGSSDGSPAWLARHHPRVRSLDLGSNLGFAEGNNRAARAFEGVAWLLFLNNDTRVPPDLWVGTARAAAAAPGDVACIGLRLVTWGGGLIDFDGGAASLTGHGHALGVGRRPPAPAAEPRETLFACGAAMLVRREVFLSAGGFAGDFFAYYEDVDLGWRLWLAGHRVWHLTGVGVEHRHHGTASALGEARRARLHERNALATLARNLGEEALAAALPAALSLAALRARPLDGRAGRDLILSAAELDVSGGLPLPAARWAGWPALAPLALDWPALLGQRQAVQALRRASDREVLPRLGRPYAPVPGTAQAEAWLRLAAERYGLERHFGPLPRASLRARLLSVGASPPERAR